MFRHATIDPLSGANHTTGATEAVQAQRRPGRCPARGRWSGPAGRPALRRRGGPTRGGPGGGGMTRPVHAHEPARRGTTFHAHESAQSGKHGTAQYPGN